MSGSTKKTDTGKTGRVMQSKTGNEKAALKSKDRIFESAKQLFAAKGFRDVSVREIASHAGVNSALLGYHFGGKQQLFDEVYRSYAEPLAAERMRRLADLTKDGKTPTVEEILRAWLLPWLQIEGNRQQKSLNVRITAHMSAEWWKHNKKASQYNMRTHTAFIDALERCLPNLSRDSLMWRLHFVIGAIAFGHHDPDSLRAYSKGRCNPDDLEATITQILPFAVKGISSTEP